MFQYLAVAFVASVCDVSSASVIAVQSNEVVQDKELVLAFLVHRHGDRTPDEHEFSLSDIKDVLRNYTDFYGFEGLTNAGRRKAYQIGKFIRQRYGSQGLGLISNLYKKDEIFLRSTDLERTKMTALVAMAAVYPPEEEQQWDDGLGKVWQPVPYTTLPMSEDYLRYYTNCKRFIALMDAAKEEASVTDFVPYKDLVIKTKSKTGRNFTEDPLLFEVLIDLFATQESLGLGIPEWAKPELDRLNEAATLAYRLYYRNEEMVQLGGGVLLNDFIEVASDISAGKPVSQRLRVFSAHDFNVGAIMDITGVAKEQTIPEYGAVFALELYKGRDGEYTVLPVYLPRPGQSSPQTYHFNGCGDSNHCKLDEFIELTKESALPESDYYELCDITTMESRRRSRSARSIARNSKKYARRANFNR